MDRKENICSRTQVERYLLNKMSPEEEFIFQRHLLKCDDCRKYLNSIRALSGFTGDEKMQIPVAEERPKGSKTLMRPMYGWISAAASVVIVIGVSIYLFRGNSGGETGSAPIIADKIDSVEIRLPEKEAAVPDGSVEKDGIADTGTKEGKVGSDVEAPIMHDLHIEHRQRAAAGNASVPVELLFPDKTIVSIDTDGEPLSFKWNREAAYRLTLKSGNDTIADVDGVGTAYTPEAGAIAGLKSIDWTLILEGEEMKGRIFLEQ